MTSRSFASFPVKKVAVWIEKTFSVSEPRRAVFMACKRGVSFEISSDEGQVLERNLEAEDVGGPWAATDIGGIQLVQRTRHAMKNHFVYEPLWHSYYIQ